MMPPHSWARSRKITRRIDKCYEGNIEGIAETDETRGLIRSVDVKTAGLRHGLVGNDSYGIAIETGETGNDIARKLRKTSK